MSEAIYKHAFPNGLVLLAEPMSWLESVAFTFSVPAGSVDDPASRCGLASFTCEMVMRGAGERDNHHLIQDLDSLGVERGESVSDAHTRFSGATVAANLPGAVSLYADILRRPHLPAEQLEAARQVLIQELRAVEDEPSQKVMIELRRRHFPEPWGRPSQGENGERGSDVAGRHPRLFRPLLSSQRRDRRRGRPLRLGGAPGPRGPAPGRLAAPACRRAGRGPAGKEIRPPALRFQPDADRHRLPQRSLPPSGLLPGLGRRWACSAAA